MNDNSPKPRHTNATWLKIGLLSFGGPAAQIALMHRLIVVEKKWLSERQYLNALSFCMLLPGPEAMQLATFAGWRIQGVRGGLIAGGLFVLPGAIVIACLAALYTQFGNLPLTESIFLGIKAAILIIVFEALLKVSRKALNSTESLYIAIASFTALFVFSIPYPLVIAISALWGWQRLTQHTALEVSNQADMDNEKSEGLPLPIIDPIKTHSKQQSNKHSTTLRTILIWLTIWLLPLFIVALSAPAVFKEIAQFFSILATVTFGGAYAVLAYMAQEAVTQYQWLSSGEMLDGLGLAETTPGPLILVTEFVGYLAAARTAPEGYGALWGVAGAIVTLWSTFIPCFLWIFAGAPYIDWIDKQPKLRAALSGVTAAVVGVIANLSLWFSLHVMLSELSTLNLGPINIIYPELQSIDWRVLSLTILAGALLLRFKLGVILVLLICATVSSLPHLLNLTS